MRYALVSDIHSNLAALDATLDALGDIDKLICMGDIIGYGPQPNEVCARLREFDPHIISISGNHDLAILGKVSLEDFNGAAAAAAIWNKEHLDESHRLWLDQFEAKTTVGDLLTLAHGSPDDPVWEYLTGLNGAMRSFTRFDTPLCFVGHTHQPRVFGLQPAKATKADTHDPTTLSLGLLARLAARLGLTPPAQSQQTALQTDPDPARGGIETARVVRDGSAYWMAQPVNDLPMTLELPQIEDITAANPELAGKPTRYIINPGSVGQPRDGDNRAAFAIYDTTAQTITFRRAEYDIERTQSIMRDAGLPASLITRLEYGL